jgi:WD40 repeat protein
VSDASFSPKIPDHEMIRLVGRGSYGEVWLARSVLGTFRAVKTVRRAAFDSARPYEREFVGIQRFEPISRAHEALVDILQVGRNEAEGFFYYVMELADDVSAAGAGLLKEESYRPLSLSARMETFGRLSARDCVLIFRGLAIGLSHLHQAGLVHRDIKPSNIIFVGGVAKFADIGLVTAADESLSYVGTEGFIPPEGAGAVTADIYSLGKVLYESGTGKDRTAFPSLPTLDHAAQDSDGLLELNAIWLKACARLPEERYQNADELASDLALLQAGRSVKRLRVVERRIRNARQLATVVGVVALLAAALGFMAKRQAIAERAVRLQSDRLRDRAEKAEHTARGSLEEARIAQARAVLQTPRIGRRQAALSLLTNIENADLRLEARSLAAAALLLPDLIPTTNAPSAPTRLVAEPAADGSIRIRKPGESASLQTLPGQGEAVRDPLVFSGNERFLYAGYGQYTERIWDWREQRLVARLDTNYYTLEFRPGHDEAAVAYVNGLVKLHGLPNWETRRGWRADDGEKRLHWSANGARLIVLSESGEVLTIEPDQDRVVKTAREKGPLQNLAWSRDGAYFASHVGNGLVQVQSVAQTPGFLMNLRQEAQVVEAVFLPPFPWIEISSWDGSSRLWDWHAGAELGRIEATGYEASFDEASRLLTWRLGMETSRRVWRLAGEEAHREIVYGDPRTLGGPYMLSWSGDGQFLASADADGVRIWEVATASEKLFIPQRSEAVWLHPAMTELYANQGGAIRHWRLRRGANGSLLAEEIAPLGPAPVEGKMAASADGSAVAWLNFGELHIAQAGNVNIVQHGQEMPETIAVSPNGKLAAVGTRNHIGARVFSTETGAFLWASDARYGSHLDFSPDSRSLAVGAEMGCHVYDAETGKLRWRASVPESELPGFWEVAFSPDSNLIAWTPKSSQVRLLDAATGGEILTLDYPTRRYITRLAFSPDGHWLAEASHKRTIHFWNIAALREQLSKMNLGWEVQKAAAK